MRHTLLLIWLLLVTSLHAQTWQDSLYASAVPASGAGTESPEGRYILRSTLFGAGFNNVLETYLTPLEYKGPELRFMHEGMRMTRLMDGKVSGQHLLQVMASKTRNPARNGEMYTGMVSWSYALHYQFALRENLKLLAGPYIDLNGGVVYNRRNSNNPAQAKAYGNIGASGMLIYKFHLGNYPMTVRYQANLPLLGAMFSPEFGESYYELFVLKNGGQHVKFTSVHNQPSLQQLVTLDFPVSRAILRVGYLCDIRQAKVNHLKGHLYSHDFLIGFVRNLYLFREKRQVSMPEKQTPF
ncbi:DUF3316 domain-containing protein [Phocaeicola barnesiae]